MQVFCVAKALGNCKSCTSSQYKKKSQNSNIECQNSGNAGGNELDIEPEVAALTHEWVNAQIKTNLAPISQQFFDLTKLVQNPTRKPPNKFNSMTSSST